MNIFKTLASGSGRLSEPNVSAFLGYLLNPKEDHGLGDVFLKKFLEPLLWQNDQLDFMKNKNLSIRSNFEIEVLLEQAFKKSNETTKIVDIVILCYEKDSQQKMSLAKTIIEQKRKGQDKPKHIFLIENKIKDKSVTTGQLAEEFKQTIELLKDWKIENPQDIISVIYLTPEDSNAKKEFDNFTKADNNKTDNKYHLFWQKKDIDSISTKDDTSISKIIKEIISEESQPIDAYCKYTLQAFLEFIESNFKSTIEEDLEKKRDNPRFKYTDRDGKEDIYSRPKLAEKIIIDYIEKENNKEITFEKLKAALYPSKMRTYPPFVAAEEAKDKGRTKGGGDRDYFCYYNNPIQIADKKICVARGCTDDELQELLDKTVKLKLDDIRI